MEDNKQSKIIHNHFEEGSNCQVFNGSLSGCIFAMPGSNVYQQIPPTNNEKKEDVDISDIDDEEDSDESNLLSCIETLMSEKESNGDWLVSQGNHWIAIFRIVVDKNLGVSESDYTGFCNMIDRIKHKEFRIPLKLDNIKKITDSNYTQPFDRWRFKTSYCKTRRPFDKMFSVAKRFKEILENNGF